jgi:3-hydroxyacyl-CoA dehydrogenase
MTISVRRDGDFAIVTIDNPPVNALSQSVRQGLFDAVGTLDRDPAVRAIVLLCAGRTFIAGADVSEFGKPPMEPHLPDVVAAIESANKPWIAAIHGTALGGGFEIAMGCRFRVARKDAKIGLPEVTLGIIPGAGGTVRTPRLAGVENAVALITNGRPVAASKALTMGLVDAVLDGDLLAETLVFSRDALTKALPHPARLRAIQMPDDDYWVAIESSVRKAARGEDAPLHALASIRNACYADFDTAMAFEREKFLALRASPQAAALRAIFFAERAAPRPPEVSGIEPRSIKSVGVIGGGTMGAGIAVALRDGGLPVVLIERDQAALDRGIGNVNAIFEALAKRGSISTDVAADRLGGIKASTDYADLADVDLVIEAVFEDLDVKRTVFARLDQVCHSHTILATNTSYLDPRAIAAGLSQPERFIGLHFFSPAHVMKLLEIIPLQETAPDVLAAAFALARSLSKIPVMSGICDGFIGNRILKIMRAQAERVLLAGATPSDVDRAMRGFGLAMGPFEAQDLGGLDIAAFQRKAARARGEAPFAPVAEKLCALGRYGQKTKRGWYDYHEGDRTPHASAVTVECISDAAQEAGVKPRIMTQDEMVHAILFPMINEGAKILAEKIAQRAGDIDLVKIHGYGFPRRTGGPMHFATAFGLQNVVTELERMAVDGLAEPPCELLRRAAAAGGWAAAGL